MLRNLAISVLEHQQITTTIGHAKAVQPLVEQMITLGKTGDLTARRRAISLLGSAKATKHLFAEVAPRFTARTGGYTRVIRLGYRKGDGASLALLELTERVVIAPPQPKQRTAKDRTADAPTTAETPPKPSASSKKDKAVHAEHPTETPAKPRRLLDGLRKLWGRRAGGDRGGSGR